MKKFKKNYFFFGSFFNVKSWHESNFNIKFWTKGREKVTPPMKIWPPGESFFNDFSTLKISLYTPANEVVEVYWFHLGLSVCLWKKWFRFLYNIFRNSTSMQWWYFTYTLTLTWGGPQLILGQKVKFGL